MAKLQLFIIVAGVVMLLLLISYNYKEDGEKWLARIFVLLAGATVFLFWALMEKIP